MISITAARYQARYGSPATQRFVVVTGESVRTGGNAVQVRYKHNGLTGMFARSETSRLPRLRMHASSIEVRRLMKRRFFSRASRGTALVETRS